MPCPIHSNAGAWTHGIPGALAMDILAPKVSEGLGFVSGSGLRCVRLEGFLGIPVLALRFRLRNSWAGVAYCTGLQGTRT